MAIVQVSVVPLGTASPSLSGYVAGAWEVLKSAEDLEYRLTPMGTVIEGDLNRILEVIEKMHESAFGPEVKRVATTIIIDDRRDKKLTMDGKLKSVEEKLSQ